MRKSSWWCVIASIVTSVKSNKNVNDEVLRTIERENWVDVAAAHGVQLVHEYALFWGSTACRRHWNSISTVYCWLQQNVYRE